MLSIRFRRRRRRESGSIPEGSAACLAFLISDSGSEVYPVEGEGDEDRDSVDVTEDEDEGR